MQNRTDLTNGPRRSSSPTSRASPSAGSTSRRPIIEDEKQAEIRESKADIEQKTREIQNTVRFEAAALPALAAAILGLVVWFVRRTAREPRRQPEAVGLIVRSVVSGQSSASTGKAMLRRSALALGAGIGTGATLSLPLQLTDH